MAYPLQIGGLNFTRAERQKLISKFENPSFQFVRHEDGLALEVSRMVDLPVGAEFSRLLFKEHAVCTDLERMCAQLAGAQVAPCLVLDGNRGIRPFSDCVNPPDQSERAGLDRYLYLARKDVTDELKPRDSISKQIRCARHTAVLFDSQPIQDIGMRGIQVNAQTAV